MSDDIVDMEAMRALRKRIDGSPEMQEAEGYLRSRRAGGPGTRLDDLAATAVLAGRPDPRPFVAASREPGSDDDNDECEPGMVTLAQWIERSAKAQGVDDGRRRRIDRLTSDG